MSFLNGLFTLLSVIFFICLIVALVKPSIFKIKTRLKAFLIFFTAMIVSSLIISATVSDEQKAAMEQQQKVAQEERKLEADNKARAEFQTKLQSVNFQSFEGMNEKKVLEIVTALEPVKKDIAKVELFNDQFLDITLKIDAAWNEAHILTKSAMTAEQILKNLKSGKIADLKNVRIHIETTLLDQYNNESQSKIFTLDYEYPEVLKLNDKNTILYQDYLKFSKFETSHKIGREVLNAWCADKDNMKYSGTFCISN